VKTVVEGGIVAAAIPEWRVMKEIHFATLHLIRVIDSQTRLKANLEMMQPIWKLQYQQQYQAQISIVFEQLLTNGRSKVK